MSLRERLELPPEASAHTVFVPGPVGHIRQQRLSHRRAQDRSRHRPFDPPFFYVEGDPPPQFLSPPPPLPPAGGLCLVGGASGQSHAEHSRDWRQTIPRAW